MIDSTRCAYYPFCYLIESNTSEHRLFIVNAFPTSFNTLKCNVFLLGFEISPVTFAIRALTSTSALNRSFTVKYYISPSGRSTRYRLTLGSKV